MKKNKLETFFAAIIFAAFILFILGIIFIPFYYLFGLIKTGGTAAVLATIIIILLLK